MQQNFRAKNQCSRHFASSLSASRTVCWKEVSFVIINHSIAAFSWNTLSHRLCCLIWMPFRSSRSVRHAMWSHLAISTSAKKVISNFRRFLPLYFLISLLTIFKIGKFTSLNISGTLGNDKLRITDDYVWSGILTQRKI